MGRNEVHALSANTPKRYWWGSFVRKQSFLLKGISRCGRGPPGLVDERDQRLREEVQVASFVAVGRPPAVAHRRQQHRGEALPIMSGFHGLPKG
jgi:hypothetical protein